jgi:hypothetical protein
MQLLPIDSNNPGFLDSRALASIRDKALFYPCCGRDLQLPIRLFASAISDFYFVDLKRPTRPKLNAIADFRVQVSGNVDLFTHCDSGREFRVHRLQRRAEDFVAELASLGVFFFRGDNLIVGEGSSGVLWLGGELFACILSLLVPGAIVVTDGSNCDENGPVELRKFWHTKESGAAAQSKANPFEYRGRSFNCIGYTEQKYGPTLIWQVA